MEALSQKSHSNQQRFGKVQLLLEVYTDSGNHMTILSEASRIHLRLAIGL